MKRVAIVYATKKKQTEKIARYMERQLKLIGHEVQLLNVDSPHSDLTFGTDTLIFGGPVYAGRYPSRLLRWVRGHQHDTRGMATALFSVTLNAADKRDTARAVDKVLLQNFMQKTSWIPDYTASFAGALKYSQYLWPIRLIMKRIAGSAGGDTDTSRDYEYTDWSQVDQFLNAVVTSQTQSEFATHKKFPEMTEQVKSSTKSEHSWATMASLKTRSEGQGSILGK